MTALFSLEGRTALVVGAAEGGLGAYAARALAAAGATVAVADLEARADDLAATARECGGSTHHVDVTDEASVGALVDAVAREHGRIDVLVACQGAMLRREIGLTSPAEWQHVLDVNLTGTFLCARAAAKLMLAGAGGAIVNVSSVHAKVGMARLAAYSASKGGTEALTRTLALEWADRGIRVNSVAPGYFATEMTEGLRGNDRWRATLLGRIPLQRFGEPAELVPAVLFLVSDSARYVTGSSISVDGGWTAA